MNFVLTAENLSYLDTNGIKKLAVSFGNYNCKIIACLRNHADYLRACWGQEVKLGVTQICFDEYVKKHMKENSKLGLDYYKFISNWAMHFGVSSIDGAWYQEQNRLSNVDCIVSKLTKSSGPLDSSVKVKPHITNQSPCYTTLEIVRNLIRFRPELTFDEKKCFATDIIKSVNSLSYKIPKQTCFSPQLLKDLRERYSRSVKDLARDYSCFSVDQDPL